MSMIITAKDNDKIKYTKSLLKSKNRNKESKFIIEGYRILTLAIECRAKLDYVFINEDFEKTAIDSQNQHIGQNRNQQTAQQ